MEKKRVFKINIGGGAILAILLLALLIYSNIHFYIKYIKQYEYFVFYHSDKGYLGQAKIYRRGPIKYISDLLSIQKDIEKDNKEIKECYIMNFIKIN